MAYARRQMNATLLPTGDVLVTGGTSSPGFNDPTGGVRTAELWHPATGRWSQLALSAKIRIYHGTALLLPDARVLFTGSGDAAGTIDQLNYEVYSPPYLFNGARPSITATLPSSVTYGQQLAVGTPDGSTVAKVTLIRFGSITHAFDQGGRLIPLGFAAAAEGLTVDFPSSRSVAPPGPYLLFLVNAHGVPSKGRIVLLQ